MRRKRKCSRNIRGKEGGSKAEEGERRGRVELDE